MPAARRRPIETVREMTGLVRVSKVYGRGENGVSFLSPDQQRAVMERFAAPRGIRITAWFEELDRSGSTTERAGLASAVEHVMARSDGLLVAKADRFARSVAQGLIAYHEIVDAGKAFVACEDGLGFGKADLFLAPMLFAMAEWQLETIRHNWLSARHDAVAAGIATVAPYGYRRLPPAEGRTLAPDPEQAPWVVRMFEWRASGMSYHAIRRRLDAEGVVPERGGSWVHNTIAQILRNRAYLGELHSGTDYDGRPISNETAHEPIVSAALWEAAQMHRKTPPKGDRIPFPLAGIVRCASCGGRMAGNAWADRRDPERRHRYYRCRRTFSWGTCPEPARVPAQEVEALVLERFEADYLTGWRFEGQPATDEVETARDAERRAEAALMRFSTAESTIAMQEGDDPAEHEAAEEGIRARRARLALARERRGELERAAGMIGGVPRNIAEVWPLMTTEEQRGWLAIAYGVVAVRPGSGAAGARVRIWSIDDAACPPRLPGVGGHREITPIPFDGMPVEPRKPSG
jgi:DNA invertase Pin-like site-specific DNA recombinase